MSEELAIQQPANQANAMLGMIERVALNPDVPIEKMEKLLDIQERMMNKQAEIDFNIAFSDMQPELPTIQAKGKGHNSTTYARKEDMNRLVNPVLKKYGFALSFSNRQEEGDIITVATLRHRSGHCEKTELRLKNDTSGSKNAVQAVGSSQSYGERYTMKSILNLTITDDETDDDAKAHDENATELQREIIARLFKECNPAQQASFAKRMGGVAEIKKKDVDTAMALLNNTLKKREANASN
jgi:hypothetical protein